MEMEAWEKDQKEVEKKLLCEEGGEVEEEAKVFDVQIALMSGTIFVVKDCQEAETIFELKKKISYNWISLPCYEQHLVLGTTLLGNRQTLQEAGVDRNSCLSLVISIPSPVWVVVPIVSLRCL